MHSQRCDAAGTCVLLMYVCWQCWWVLVVQLTSKNAKQKILLKWTAHPITSGSSVSLETKCSVSK